VYLRPEAITEQQSRFTVNATVTFGQPGPFTHIHITHLYTGWFLQRQFVSNEVSFDKNTKHVKCAVLQQQRFYEGKVPEEV
jgi:hypothetical protein